METTGTAVVTGGSIGFGRVVAAALVEHGWQVLIDGRDEDAVRRTAAEIGAQPRPGDVTDPHHRRELLDVARLDLLVNNASTLGPSPLPSLATYPLDRLRQVYETNLEAPLAIVQLALPLLEISGGAVINVTSDAAVEPYEGWGGYGSSKAALEAVTAVLAAENPGVRFWSFDPGDMRTRMHQEAFPGEDISDRPEPATVVPAVLRLIEQRPASGRVRAADLLAVAG
ncbi:MAG TPA: SDR family NAD(P)-dependent oxidoreductase [Acidimicrobiales bacterium]|jgi:NAD(P)-dependent dehydrogenase (short-subunit alcohol dehydrogenase family)|nr:SDR family NAD(P)-dependent oxidoreductase [Acidimicrobiales bacterium]